ncbi:MAG: glycosyltransferase family 4 protein [Tissierellia bacterium]|nr:glycosyltransferase family 4 protein [Tissierellia bacterium]
MRILHVLAQLPSKTGSGVYFSNIIKGLKNKYEQACVFGFQDDFYYDILNREFQYAVEFNTERMPFNIVGMSDEMPYASTRYCDLTEEMQDIWNINFSQILHRALSEFKPDIIICHHLWMLTSLVIDKAVDKKVIGICHGTDIRQCEKNPELKEKYLKNINKLDHIFALSELQVPEIKRIYSADDEKIIVMGGGFDQNIFYRPEKKEKNDEIKIVYAGKIAEAKGVYEFIEAVKKIEDGLEIKIIGAKDDEQEKELRQIVKGHENFEIMQVIPQIELANIFRESDIFVLPSYFEGLGLVAIEALACGMRVVSSEIEGLINLLGEDIINSGAIEIVELPRLQKVDKPLKEDIDGYILRLKEAIEKQVDRIRSGKEIDEKIRDSIDDHSWARILSDIEKIIEK